MNKSKIELLHGMLEELHCKVGGSYRSYNGITEWRNNTFGLGVTVDNRGARITTASTNSTREYAQALLTINDLVEHYNKAKEKVLKDYIVERSEIHVARIRVRAESREEAIRLVERGDYDSIEPAKFTHIQGSGHWQVKE